MARSPWPIGARRGRPVDGALGRSPAWDVGGRKREPTNGRPRRERSVTAGRTARAGDGGAWPPTRRWRSSCWEADLRWHGGEIRRVICQSAATRHEERPGAGGVGGWRPVRLSLLPWLRLRLLLAVANPHRQAPPRACHSPFLR
ncbi:hypothetical protein PVAP13_1NG429719 [Panicum virgatum]|uniref:Uncharacterized protein n=1 Tax=Panicum virgatum TaxID=38727 RepID=A0A8T0WZ49_PANVG|nr:hypothetical protein PVAP13_1NG429719 [Panicum virgatum]